MRQKREGWEDKYMKQQEEERGAKQKRIERKMGKDTKKRNSSLLVACATCMCEIEGR